jgi:cold shock CspA family protein
MSLNGKLRSWSEDRGFGFIAPTDGGRELFVHVSAFPRDGSRPVVGESLTYELGRGKEGKPQATSVRRHALGQGALGLRETRPPLPARRGSRFKRRTALLMAAIVGTYAYNAYEKQTGGAAMHLLEPSATANETLTQAPTTTPVDPPFRCDGRTHCSQMTSCGEAKFFLENCPGVAMDGNHDGVPCEQQWCKQ